jgi:hypothetical protein
VDEVFVNFLKSRSETRPAASQQKKASELFFESLIPEFEKSPVQEQRDREQARKPGE